MKKHLVNIWYDTPYGNYSFCGMIEEVLGYNGKAIVFPCGIFKKAFGFSLPSHSIITLL